MVGTSSEPSANDESPVGIVPPKAKADSVLCEWDIQTINKMFDDMVKSKSISQVEIKKRCSSRGAEMLEAFERFPNNEPNKIC